MAQQVSMPFVHKGDRDERLAARARAQDAEEDAILHHGNGNGGPFVVSPSVVHFGGYEPGKTHKIMVSVINVSANRQRVNIFPPKTGRYRIKFNKKGLLAPGMSETITVHFCSPAVDGVSDGNNNKAMPHYEDRLRIECGSHKTVIPMHAYPLMNQTVFPKLVDFGVCALSERHMRVAWLECKAPFSFDFELSMVSARSEFSVSPMKGKVPANGRVAITIEFTPRHMTVVNCAFKLSLSQYNFTPVVCTVVGSSCPGIVRTKFVKKHSINFAEELEGDERLSPTVKNAMKRVNFDEFADPMHRMGRGIGSGAVYDPGAVVLNEEKELFKKISNNGGNKAMMPHSNESKGEDEEEKRFQWIDGIKVPLALVGVQATNYVLTQEIGKLKPKDLKNAISKHRAREQKEREEQEQAARQLLSTKSSNGDGILPSFDSSISDRRSKKKKVLVPCVDSVAAVIASDQAAVDQSTTRQVKEMEFLQQVLEVEEDERARAFSSHTVHIGATPLDNDQIFAIKAARKAAAVDMERSTRRVQREAWVNELVGPSSTPPVRVRTRSTIDPHITAQVQAQAQTEKDVTIAVEEKEKMMESDQCDEAEGDAAMDANEQEKTESKSEEFTAPSFNYFENDIWRRRKLVIVRFTNAVGKVIIQNRAKRRLAVIWARLGNARTRNEVRAIVDEDTIQIKLSSGPSGETYGDGDGDEEPEWRQCHKRLLELSNKSMHSIGIKEKLKALAFPSDKNGSSCEEGKGDQASDEEDRVLQGSQQQQQRANGNGNAAIGRSAILSIALSDQSDLHLVSFPLYNDIATLLETKQEEQTRVKGFQDLGLFRLRMPEEYQLCGYSRFSVPQVPQYVPKFENMGLRYGAAYESSWREEPTTPVLLQAPCKPHQVEYSLSKLNAMPVEWSTDQRRPCFELLLPSRTTLMFEQLPQFTEFDPEFYLQPRASKYEEARMRGNVDAWQVGVSSLLALAKEPTISDRWRQNKTPYSIQTLSLWDCNTLLNQLMTEGSSDDMLSEDEGSDVEDTEQYVDDDGGESSTTLSLSDARSLFKAPRLQDENTGGEKNKDTEDEQESQEPTSESKQKYIFAHRNTHKELLALECESDRERRLELITRAIEKCNDTIADKRIKFNLTSLT